VRVLVFPLLCSLVSRMYAANHYGPGVISSISDDLEGFLHDPGEWRFYQNVCAVELARFGRFFVAHCFVQTRERKCTPRLCAQLGQRRGATMA
jgi:hypothetical protein